LVSCDSIFYSWSILWQFFLSQMVKLMIVLNWCFVMVFPLLFQWSTKVVALGCFWGSVAVLLHKWTALEIKLTPANQNRHFFPSYLYTW
jgi:hypothetical protein